MYFELGGVGIFRQLKPEGGGHGTFLLQNLQAIKRCPNLWPAFPPSLTIK